MHSSRTPREYYQSDVSRTTVPRRHLSQLTTEDKLTYRKWKRATLIVYGAVAMVVVVLSMVIGPTDSASNKGEMYSSLGPAAHRSR